VDERVICDAEMFGFGFGTGGLGGQISQVDCFCKLGAWIGDGGFVVFVNSDWNVSHFLELSFPN